MTTSSFAVDDLWRSVEATLDGMDERAVRIHRVVPLAARRYRAVGRELPPDFAHEDRAARTAALIVPALMRRVRDAYDGRLLLFKGPEVAARYPDNARSFDDVDLLVADVREAQRALIAAGFVEVPDPTGHFRDIHHLAPLVSPRLPLKIELHERPKWPRGVGPPLPAELFEAAVPAACGIAGVEAPAPHHHALLVAAHAWAHTPLQNLRDLIDVAATAAEADRANLLSAARAWHVDRMWSTTWDTVEWKLRRTVPRPLPVLLWARHLLDLREATVLEGHVERWLSPFWLLPARQALPLSLHRLAADFKPSPGDSWPMKARRFARAARNAFVTKSEHGWKNEDAPPPVKPPR